MSKKIAVDFDGTLWEYAFPNIGTQTKEQKELLELLIELRQEGHKIILWTNRGDNDEYKVLTEAIDWCRSKGLEFDAVFLPGWEEGLFPNQKSIEEKGQNGLEEERRLAYVGITRAKKKAVISFSMNRFYQGDWIDSMASRFIDELPEKYLEKNSFFDEDKVELEDFEFNQDYEVEDNERSPGWIRYQKRIKWLKIE